MHKRLKHVIFLLKVIPEAHTVIFIIIVMYFYTLLLTHGHNIPECRIQPILGVILNQDLTM